MADKSVFTVLFQCLEHLCPKIAPQIVPVGDTNAKQIIESLQHEVIKSRKSTTQVSFCEFCGRATVDEDGKGMENMTARSVLRWDIDFIKKCVKIVRLQLACQDCQVLLNLQKLLTFFAMPEEEFDQTKLYLLACHFSLINGHNSESGEEDITLLQQAVAAAHALHVLTKNMVGITVQGPDDQVISLDACHEVAKSLLEKGRVAVKKKKRGEKATVGQIDAEDIYGDRNKEFFTKTPKKFKKAKTKDSNVRNVHTSAETNNNEDTTMLDAVQASKSVNNNKKRKMKNRQILSEKKPKKFSSVAKHKISKKSRRSAPGMASGLGHED